MNVLLVDDEADFLEIMVKRLAKRGLAVASCNSGRAALAHMAANPTDVVVLDVKMPEMDGLEVLSSIRRAHPGTEVIMLSGHADVGTAIQGMEHGAFDYMLKPVDLNELLYKIEDAYAKLSLKRGGDGS